MAEKSSQVLNRRDRRHPERAAHVRPERRWASMQHGADYAGVGLRTLRDWIAKGVINGYRVNSRVIRVDLNEIDGAMAPFTGWGSDAS